MDSAIGKARAASSPGSQTPAQAQPPGRPKMRRSADSFLRELNQSFRAADASLHRAFTAINSRRRSSTATASAPPSPTGQPPAMAKVLQQAEASITQLAAQEPNAQAAALANDALAIIRRASTDAQADALGVATALVQAVVAHLPDAPGPAGPAIVPAQPKPQQAHPRPLGANPVWPMPPSER